MYIAICLYVYMSICLFVCVYIYIYICIAIPLLPPALFAPPEAAPGKVSYTRSPSEILLVYKIPDFYRLTDILL